MQSRSEQRGALVAIALWALFIYASAFSDWLEPNGGTLLAGSAASSYLD
jgi:hypothetical protein